MLKKLYKGIIVVDSIILNNSGVFLGFYFVGSLRNGWET